MYLEVCTLSLMDPSSPENSGDHSGKEERAGWTELALVSGHLSQLDCLPSDSKIPASERTAI